jgi:ferredoxin-thioredoxin reductase catalytic subunit
MRIELNPNKEYVKALREQLAANNNYCPCSLIKTDDTKCICKAFRDMEEGYCHCGLYIKTKD